jgi:hypothetical protein
MVESARALLTHGETQTTKDHYILGQSLAAGRHHAGLIAKLRQELGNRPGRLPQIVIDILR